MKVTKVTPTAAPKTATYEVDPEEGEYTFVVSLAGAGHPSLAEGVALCWQHGEDCDHAKAVLAHVAK